MNDTNKFELFNKFNIMKQLNRQTQDRFSRNLPRDEPKQVASMEKTYYIKTGFSKPKP